MSISVTVAETHTVGKSENLRLVEINIARLVENKQPARTGKQDIGKKKEIRATLKV